MKNRLFPILTALFIVLTYTSNSITQDLQDDPQQGDLPDSTKVRPEKILPVNVSVYDIEFSLLAHVSQWRETSVFCSMILR